MSVPVQFNSTTYVDMLGVMAGLKRFLGETADEFLERIKLASRLDRGASKAGLLNELNLQFGLSPYVAMTVFCPPDAPRLEFSIFGADLGGMMSVPLVNMDQDGLWSWKRISEVAAEISQAGTGHYATPGQDGPAIHIVSQNNLAADTAVVKGLAYRTKEEDMAIDPNSVLFSAAVPHYTISGREIHFSQPVQNEVRLDYAYYRTVYPVIAYPASVLALNDPGLLRLADSHFRTGDLPYQMKEYLQEVMKADQSYWGA